ASAQRSRRTASTQEAAGPEGGGPPSMASATSLLAASGEGAPLSTGGGPATRRSVQPARSRKQRANEGRMSRGPRRPGTLEQGSCVRDERLLPAESPQRGYGGLPPQPPAAALLSGAGSGGGDWVGRWVAAAAS